jgi:hypothetical protein
MVERTSVKQSELSGLVQRTDADNGLGLVVAPKANPIAATWWRATAAARSMDGGPAKSYSSNCRPQPGTMKTLRGGDGAGEGERAETLRGR